jgi:hypothetical protein
VCYDIYITDCVVILIYFIQYWRLFYYGQDCDSYRTQHPDITVLVVPEDPWKSHHSALRKQHNAQRHGSVVVGAICYKVEGRRFETRWSELIVPIYLIYPAALGPGVYSASNMTTTSRNMFLG